MAVVEVRDLRRSFGGTEAVAGVSFRVDGGIVGLLGPNGAGKTTTLRVLVGLLAPTSGTVTVDGIDVLLDPVAVRRRVGFLPEGAPSWNELSVAEHHAFVGRARGMGPAERARAEQRVVEATDLGDRLRQTLGTLSRGYRQRVGLAAALLHDPPLLVLDEPTTGLDPNQVADVRALVRELARTRTVLLSTHILSEVELVCDRVLILHKGRLVADDPTAAVLAATRGQVLLVGVGRGKVVARDEDLAAELRAVPGVREVRPAAPLADASRFEVHADGDVREAVFRWAVAAGHVLVELTPAGRNLEDVFRRLTEVA